MLVALHLIVQTEDENGTRATVYDETHPPVCARCGASLDEGGTVAGLLAASDRPQPGLVFHCQRHSNDGG